MPPITRRKATTARKPRRTQLKKQVVKAKKHKGTQNSPSKPSSTRSNDFEKNNEVIDFEGSVDHINVTPPSGCSTPKGQKFRIPEILTCPPAPKKQRLLSNCSFKRSPIAFFAPPDLELFFYFALRRVSV